MDNGVNALVAGNHRSPSHSFLKEVGLAGQHVWLNAPFDSLEHFVSHYLQLKALSPASTSACILVPRWPKAPWAHLLHSMQRLKSFPIGYPLFVDPTADNKAMPGIPWPVDIYFDPPYVPLAVQAARSLKDDTQMLMNNYGLSGKSQLPQQIFCREKWDHHYTYSKGS